MGEFMKSNKKQLEEWYSYISQFEKLDIANAKKLLKMVNNETDLVKKKNLREELINKTLYVPYIFVRDNCLFLNSCIYNMEDIINICNIIWIDILDSEKLFEVDIFSKLFVKEFYPKLTEQLIDKKYPIGYSSIIDGLTFSEILHEFIKLKNNIIDFDYNSFLDFINNDSRFYKLLYGGKGINIYELLEAIYQSIGNSKLELSKAKTNKLRYILIHNGLEYLNIDVNKVVIKDSNECIVEKMHQQYILNFIFNNLDLSDRDIFILKNRFGFYDGRPKTLKEIGDLLDLTPEWIRKQEKKIISKLKRNKTLRKFNTI